MTTNLSAQAGDQVRVAKSIIVEDESTSLPHHPLRGNDAFEGSMAKLDELRKEFIAGEAVARSADFSQMALSSAAKYFCNQDHE